jgi:DNA-binding response OmpR family regulator
VSPRILLVDDDAELCRLIAEYLGQSGLQISVAHSGEAGLQAVQQRPPDLILLDVSLGGMSGFDVLHRLRLFSAVPVLMLTARDEEVDRIAGLEAGADDYLTKPFNPRELLARIQAIMRRTHPAVPLPSDRLAVGTLTMLVSARQCLVDGNGIALTEFEYRVLEALVRNAGRAVSRAELTQLALGRRYTGLERSIDTHVSTLRRKLGEAFERSTPLVSVRGTGYKLCLPG